MKKSSQGFFGTLTDTLMFLFKNIGSYIWVSILLTIPALLIGLAFAYFSGFTPATMNTTEGGFAITSPIFWVMIAGFILMILSQIFVALTLLRLTAKLYNQENWNTKELAMWAWMNLLKYIGLILRIFGYTYAWLFIISIFGYAIVSMLSILGVFPASGLSIANFILGLLTIVGIFMMILRVPRSIFAQYTFAEGDTSGKQALIKSIQISEGNWLKIVGYMIGSGIIVAIIAGLIMEASSSFGEWVMGGVNLSIQIIFGYFFLVFYMVLYKNLEK